MKDTLLTILTVLGVTVILGLATYFPYIVIYDFTLQQMVLYVMGSMPINPFLFRAKVTVGAVVVAAALILLMLLLRRASRALDLKLFERVLSGVMYYVGIVTLLMLAGMWLDFRVGLPVSPNHPGDFCRVGFFFYINYIM